MLCLIRGGAFRGGGGGGGGVGEGGEFAIPLMALFNIHVVDIFTLY